VIPDALNDDPAIEIPETVTGAVPVEERVSDCETVCPTLTLPKATVVELTPRVGSAAFNWIETVCVVLPTAEADRVTFCEVVTAAMDAVKLALDEPAGMVTEFGTVTAELPLLRLIARLPVDGAVVKAMLQTSVPAPVMEALLQVKLFRLADASDVAVKFTARLPDEELDPTVSTPV